MKPNRLAAFGLAAGLLGGGAAGFAFGTPGFAGAQTDDTTMTDDSSSSTASPAGKGQWMADALAPLVDNGTVTQAQADAVIDALEAARPARHHGGRRMGPARLEAAAEALGMTVEDLRRALSEGQSLAEVAQGQGVDPEQVVNALVAEAQAHINDKVADGRITQEQADEMLSNLTERIRAFVNGEAPAFGGPGHRHGPGGFGDARFRAPASGSTQSSTAA